MGKHCSVQLMLAVQTLFAHACPMLLKDLCSSSTVMHMYELEFITITLLCLRSELVFVIVYIILYTSLPHCAIILHH